MSNLPLVQPIPALPAQGAADFITRLRQGEADALEQAYRGHAAGLLALVYRLTGSSEDAEDVVQDLFVGLPEALGRYQEQGRFEAWLRRIAIRLALIRIRSRTRRREVGLEGPDDALSSGTSPQGESLHLWLALEHLPEDQRAIVVLRVVEGYCHEEIGALLGISRGAAQVRFHRAVNQLRRTLEGP